MIEWGILRYKYNQYVLIKHHVNKVKLGESDYTYRKDCMYKGKLPRWLEGLALCSLKHLGADHASTLRFPSRRGPGLET